jgi:hypothetical protein
LKCNQDNEVCNNSSTPIFDLRDQLKKHYSEISFKKGDNDPKYISPTDTLISKVMLGTLGCIPAYDRYFVDGLKKMKMHILALLHLPLICCLIL